MPRSNNSGSDQCALHSCASNCRMWQCAIVAIVLLALVHIPVLQAQQPKVSEYQVKATYLYNFGRFVHWSPNATATKGDSFSICVLGQDPFGPTLDSTLVGETQIMVAHPNRHVSKRGHARGSSSTPIGRCRPGRSAGCPRCVGTARHRRLSAVAA